MFLVVSISSFYRFFRF